MQSERIKKFSTHAQNAYTLSHFFSNSCTKTCTRFCRFGSTRLNSCTVFPPSQKAVCLPSSTTMTNHTTGRACCFLRFQAWRCRQAERAIGVATFIVPLAIASKTRAVIRQCAPPQLARRSAKARIFQN